MPNLRFQVVEEAFTKKPVEVSTPAVRPSEYFARKVFTRAKMFKYLQPPMPWLRACNSGLRRTA